MVRHVVNSALPFIYGWTELEKVVAQNSADHGFSESYKEANVVPMKLMLIVSEVAEAMEADRHGNPASTKTPNFTGLEEELADVVIRIMDLAANRGLRIPDAIVAKMDYNAGREFKHGGKAY